MSSYHGTRPAKETSCAGKSPFGTHKLAKAAAEKMRNRGCHVEPYHCAYCGHHHVGTSHKSRKRTIVMIASDAETGDEWQRWSQIGETR